ncbi:MAG: XdhC family protein, partial [Bacteroidota bacterium]
LPIMEEWMAQKKAFAMARVIKTWGSSPRPIGSTMLVSEEMELAGSVSGGCVEGAVIKASMPLIEGGTGQRLAYGVADEDAWAVGLSCGGKIQVFAEKFLAFDERAEEKAVWQQLSHNFQNNNACILFNALVDGVVKHSLVEPDGTLIGHPLSDTMLARAMQAFRERKSQVFEEEDASYFAHVFPRKSQMLVIGAAHITVDLVELANLFGFETIVIDPRGVFSQKTQFTVPPDQLFDQYPAEVLPDFTLDPYTYAVVLSHDPKIDDNALHLLLPSEVGYIGALGSRKTHAKRTARLEAAGFPPEAIARIKAPIGMDINAKSPREIALAIMGEIIQAKNEFL